MCLLGWSLTNKILPGLPPSNFLWCLKMISFFLRMKCMSLLMNMFISLHFDLPYINVNLQMMCCGNRRWRTLWRTTSSMHDHTSTWKSSKSSNSCNPRWNLRSCSFLFSRLAFPFKRIMAFYLTLGKEWLQNKPSMVRITNLNGVGWDWYLGHTWVIETSKSHMCWENVEQTIIIFIHGSSKHCW